MIRFDFSFEKVLEWAIILGGATLGVMFAALAEAIHPMTFVVAGVAGGGMAYLAINRDYMKGDRK
jgi:hypothetical protein